MGYDEGSVLRDLLERSGIRQGIVELVGPDDLRHILDSRAMAESLGTTPATLRGRLWSELGASLGSLRTWIGNCRRSQETFTPVTFTYQDPSGGTGTTWLQATVSYLGTPPGGSPRFAFAIVEITGRRQADEILRKAVERSDLIIANVPAMIYEMDLAGTRFLSVNDPMCQMLGYTREELMAMKPADLIDEESRVLFRDRIRQTAAGEAVPEAAEYRGHTRDGREMFVSVRTAFVHREGGPASAIVVAHDITGRKRAEELLRESRLKYQDLIETMNDVIWETDDKGRFTFCSPRVQEIWGIRPDEMIGKSPSDLMPPDDRERASRLFNDLALAPRAFSGLVTSAWISPDRLIQVETSGTPFFDSCGRLLGYRGVTRDVTARKLAEAEIQDLLQRIEHEKERLSALIESLPDEVWFADDEGNLELVNPAVMNAFGDAYLAGDVRAIASRAEVYRPDLTPRPVEEAPPLRALAGEIVRGQEEIVRIPSLGILRHRQVNAAPVRDNEGRIIGSVSVVRDITALKEAEERWRRSEERFRLALRNAPVSVSVQDTGLVYRWVYNLRTRLPEEMVGRTDADLFAEADACRLTGLKKEVLATGMPVRQKVWLTDSMDRRFFDLHIEPLRNGNGKITGVGVTSVDLTEQQIAEDALRESEEKYSALFHESPFAIVLIRQEDQVVTEANQAFLSGFGYSRDQIIGRRPVEAGIVDPRSYAEIVALMETDGSIRDFRCTQNTGSGEERDVLIDIVPVSIGDSPYLLATIRDITDRKRIEAELQQKQAEIRALFDNIPAGLVLFGGKPPYHILVHNRYYQEFFAEPYRSQGMAGLTIFDYAPEVEAAGVIAVLEEAIRTRQPQYMIDFPYQPDPPRQSWFNWYLAPIEIDGEIVALVSMSLDVTDRHLAGEALRRGMEKLDILAESARLLLSSEPTEQIVRKICRRVMQHLDCQLFFNYLVEPSSGRMRLNAYGGIDESAAKEIAYLDLGVAVCGCVGRDGRRIIAEHIQESTDDLTALVRSFGAAAYACHPLMYLGIPIGTLSFGTRTRSSFTEEEIELMQAVADLVATAMARKRSEAALRQSESQLLNALELLNSVTKQSGVMIAAEDTDLCYTYFNKAYADEIMKITGREPSLGTSMADLFSALPDEQRASVRQWRKVLSGISVRETLTFGSPGGTRRTFNVIHTPIKDEMGAVIGAGEVSYDVTRQIQIEENLRKTSRYLENLITYANAPIIVWDPEFRITRFNRAFERLTGRKEAEVRGETPAILIPEQFRGGAMELIRRTTSGDRWEVVEIPILHTSGEIRTVLWNSATLYDDDGTSVIATIAQGQDITDRKHAEDLILLEKKRAEEAFSLLNAAIESTTEGMYVVDTDRKVTSFNQNFCSLWNIPYELLDTGDDREITAYILDQVQDQDGFSERVLDLYDHPDRESYDTIRLSDGRIFERHSKPQRLGSEIIGRVWSYQDVTEKRLAEQTLIASVQEKETLIREIHHRVKNNLQIISGLLDMTRMRTSDATTRGILTEMMMKIKTMAQIHSRLYESKQLDRVNMGRQIRDQISDLSSIYDHSETEIRTELEAGEIFLNVEQAIPFALVVNEILSNAFKHAFQGRREGSLSVSMVDVGGRVRLSVRDDGIGIPEDVDVYRTTSLGFKLIRSLVNQLNGSVSVKGNHGTEVVVEFPIPQVQQ